jgi:hypothetical protein
MSRTSQTSLAGHAIRQQGAGCVGNVDERYLAALLRKGFHHGFADPARSSGNEDPAP